MAGWGRAEHPRANSHHTAVAIIPDLVPACARRTRPTAIVIFQPWSPQLRFPLIRSPKGPVNPRLEATRPEQRQDSSVHEKEAYEDVDKREPGRIHLRPSTALAAPKHHGI